MFQNVLSRESSRRGAAERQRRWRAWQRVKRQTEDRLRQRLGRDPTPAEMRDEIETRLAGSGLAPEPVGVDRREGAPAGKADSSPDVAVAGVDDGDDHSDLYSADGLRELHRLAGWRSPPSDRSQADGADVGRGVALASVSFELRIAAERDKIFGLLMQRAEEGDASALLL